MHDIVPLLPRKPVPPLSVPLIGGGRFDLASENPKNFSLVVFYRGLHCPVCRRYLGELDPKIDEFEKRGVNVVAISSDNEERAEKAKRDWELPIMRVGHDLPLETARSWGLYISTSRGKTSAGIEEPPLFSEPGLFLVRPDNTLYYGSVQTMPFARPHFTELLAAVDFALDRNYPARGEVENLPPAAA
ncbi:MAG: peroxiredoxin-like family protein [Xanthobacteraceae bacterium]